jgi:hypothetical protein
MSRHFVDGIFGTLLLEQEYVAIEETVCEANQDAVYELTGGATGGYGSKEHGL